jgi:putative flippase GtrA
MVLRAFRFILRLQIVRFGMVSGFSTVVDYSTLGLLTLLIPSGAAFVSLSVAVAYLAGTTTHFAVSRRLVFRPSRFAKPLEFLLVLTVAVIGLGLTEAITLALNIRLGWNLFLAKSLSVCLVFFWNFLARRHLVYGGQRSLPDSAD